MIEALTGAGAAPPETAALRGLDRDAFLKMLVAQLRYQNPLSPVDGQEYLAQAAQFATVERLETLARAQSETVAYQQLLLSSSLVGRHVRGAPVGGGDPVEGVVDAVRFPGGAPVLVIGGTELPLGSVEEVTAPRPTTAP